MIRRAGLSALLLLTAVACTGGLDDSDLEGDADPGRLVVVDEDGDIVVLSLDGVDPVAVTEDGGDDAFYSQPTWSPDGASLAWGQLTTDGFALGFAEVGGSAPSTVGMSGLPFYSFWSPDGNSIGVLHNGASGLDFEVVDVQTRSASTLEQGSPFYFSWSPESREVVAHIESSRFDAIDLDGAVSGLGPTDRGYLAPQWTDGGILHVVDQALVLLDRSGSTRPVAQVADFTTFVANEQASRVALQTTGDEPDISVSLVEVLTLPRDSVVIVDVATGGFEVALDTAAVGFFWSPDGEALLMLTPDGTNLSASVWTSDGGSNTYATFVPSEVVVRELLPFFPQYAQSMSFWSPDSSAFAYAGDGGIWVQDLDGSAPKRISGGSWVAWSR